MAQNISHKKSLSYYHKEILKRHFGLCDEIVDTGFIFLPGHVLLVGYDHIGTVHKVQSSTPYTKFIFCFVINTKVYLLTTQQ